MDATRFDRWTRSLATVRTRRGVVTAVGAAALAALLGGGDPESVAADRSRRRHSGRSGPPVTPCGVAGHPCGDQQPCCAGLTCGASGHGAVRRCAPCPGGLCADTCQPPCRSAEHCCNGVCVDTDTDASNCGFCGFHCIPDVPCVGGTCQGGCVAPFTMCLDGSCCDTSQCSFCRAGTCFSVCQEGQRCENNTCICDDLSCPPEQGCCTGGPAGGQCKAVDLNTDPKNCGGCGNTCAAGVRCVGGDCQGGCDPRLERCPDGTCCDASQCQFCKNGSCVSACQTGQRCVDNACICDQQSCPKGCCQGPNGQCRALPDQGNSACGAGGATCAACQPPEGCCGGSCCRSSDDPGAGGPVCCWRSGSPVTHGTCVDRSSDPNNCGECFHTCAADQRCVAGRCVCDGQTCPNGCCDAQGRCRPGNTNQVCGRGGGACATCGAGNHCVAGQCICDAQSCANFQCCENGPGNPGRCFITDDAHCAIGGAQCVECGFLEQCNVARGQCQ